MRDNQNAGEMGPCPVHRMTFVPWRRWQRNLSAEPTVKSERDSKWNSCDYKRSQSFNKTCKHFGAAPESGEKRRFISCRRNSFGPRTSFASRACPQRILREGAEKNFEISEILQRYLSLKIPVVQLSSQIYSSISPVDTSAGIICEIRIPEDGNIKKDEDWIYLDGVQDPGNVGTIASGVTNIALSQHVLTSGPQGSCVPPWELISSATLFLPSNSKRSRVPLA